MNKVGVGLLLVLVKFVKFLLPLAAKAIGIVAKLFKGAGEANLGLGAASFGVYSVLYDWRFAVTILLLIGIHESGHVWAMRRMGMRTRGFYFIPFFGGMAVPEDAFPSAWAEGYVALMGPIWGLFVTAATYVGFLMTGEVVYEVAACWMAFVNLLNLLPIFPFDGGRVARSLAESAKGMASVVIVMAVSALGIVFCFLHGYGLFGFFGVLGFFEAWGERKQRMKAMTATNVDEPWARQAFNDFACAAGCSPNATRDDIERALKRIRAVSPSYAIIFQKYRAEYAAWLKDWRRLSDRWDRMFGLKEISSVAWFGGLIVNHGQDTVRVFREDLERPVSWRGRIKSATADGRIFLPDTEYERARVLVDRLLSIMEKARLILTIVDGQVSRQCAATGVSDNRVIVDRAGWFPDEIWNRDPMVLRVIIALGATPMDERHGEHFQVGHGFNFHSFIPRTGESRLVNTRENWFTATGDLLFFGLVDPDLLNPVWKLWAKHSHEQFAMTTARSFVIAATYVILAATLFLLMAGTGGHTAATHAVEFFKGV